jgi:hypothetical protein
LCIYRSGVCSQQSGLPRTDRHACMSTGIHTNTKTHTRAENHCHHNHHTTTTTTPALLYQEEAMQHLHEFSQKHSNKHPCMQGFINSRNIHGQWRSHDAGQHQDQAREHHTLYVCLTRVRLSYQHMPGFWASPRKPVPQYGTCVSDECDAHDSMLCEQVLSCASSHAHLGTRAHA